MGPGPIRTSFHAHTAIEMLEKKFDVARLKRKEVHTRNKLHLRWPLLFSNHLPLCVQDGFLAEAVPRATTRVSVRELVEFGIYNLWYGRAQGPLCLHLSHGHSLGQLDASLPLCTVFSVVCVLLAPACLTARNTYTAKANAANVNSTDKTTLPCIVVTTVNP